ncbi:MAG: type secretion system protein GspE, partial [Solirubrobacterales bacterium]|nr:type secretion system protein GspE [Solirubrobacterales bacterium]
MTDNPPPTLRAVSGDDVPRRAGLTPSSGASDRRLIDVVGDLGFASRERIAAAIETGRAAGRPAERVLLEQGTIDADQLARAIAERYGLDHVDLDAFDVEAAAVQLLAPTIAARYEAVPISFVDDHTLLVAVVDPANAPALEDIATRTRLEVRAAVASGEALARLLRGEVRPPAPVVDLREATGTPDLELARSVLGEAVRRGASSVHVQPGSVRLRIDGALAPSTTAGAERVAALLASFKALADGGSARLAVDGRSLGIAVSTLPGLDGESLVVRVRNRDAPAPRLDALGLGAEERRRVDDALTAGSGAVLLAGPAGRRTEALYAILAAVVSAERRVVAVV